MGTARFLYCDDTVFPFVISMRLQSFKSLLPCCISQTMLLFLATKSSATISLYRESERKAMDDIFYVGSIAEHGEILLSINQHLEQRLCLVTFPYPRILKYLTAQPLDNKHS